MVINFTLTNITISTHTPHARRDGKVNKPIVHFFTISTHTPHARRDLRDTGSSYDLKISTHTPHARRDAVCPLPFY